MAKQNVINSNFQNLLEEAEKHPEQKIKENYTYAFNQETDYLDPYEIGLAVNAEGNLVCRYSGKADLPIAEGALPVDLHAKLVNACKTKAKIELSAAEQQEIANFALARDYVPKLLPTTLKEIKARMEDILASIGLKRDLLNFQDIAITREEPKTPGKTGLKSARTPAASAASERDDTLSPWGKPLSRFKGGAAKEKDTALHIAAKNGNLKALRTALENPDINPNALSADGETALHLLCRHGHATLAPL